MKLIIKQLNNRNFIVILTDEKNINVGISEHLLYKFFIKNNWDSSWNSTVVENFKYKYFTKNTHGKTLQFKKRNLAAQFAEELNSLIVGFTLSHC